ncbi:MAG TPA: RusA family crossover junction endodeoxyribonuclease [Roseiflexaceae bacterium]|nr:RusA family crossover junction endodeoxyribonuclease [Roseiflexaceae bacterium]
MRLSFELALPPGINQQYYTHRGLHVLTPQSRRYRKAVEQQMLRMYAQDLVSDSFLAAMRQGYLSLFFRYYFETPLRRDLDGGLKITVDAITSGLGAPDDSRVVDIHLLKYIDPLRTRLEVDVEIVEAWDWKAETESPWASIALTLPLPPSINSQYVVVDGQRHRGSALRRFRREVKAAVDAHAVHERIPATFHASGKPGYLGVYADFYFKNQQRRDVDNGLKSLLDAFCSAVDVNDARVVDIHLTKRVSRAAPRTELQVELFDDWQFTPEHAVRSNQQRMW